MFITKNLIIALTKIIDILISSSIFIIFIDAIFSIVQANRYNKVVYYINTLANLIMSPVRKKFNLILKGMDFTPVVVILTLVFIQSFLIKSLLDFAYKL